MWLNIRRKYMAWDGFATLNPHLPYGTIPDLGLNFKYDRFRGLGSERVLENAGSLLQELDCKGVC